MQRRVYIYMYSHSEYLSKVPPKWVFLDVHCYLSFVTLFATLIQFVILPALELE
jgi:hypothetical protein